MIPLEGQLENTAHRIIVNSAGLDNPAITSRTTSFSHCSLFSSDPLALNLNIDPIALANVLGGFGNFSVTFIIEWQQYIYPIPGFPTNIFVNNGQSGQNSIGSYTGIRRYTTEANMTITITDPGSSGAGTIAAIQAKLVIAASVFVCVCIIWN